MVQKKRSKGWYRGMGRPLEAVEGPEVTEFHLEVW